MDELDRQIEKAIRQGEQRGQGEPRALAVDYDGKRKRLVMQLSTGAELAISPTMLGLAAEADLSEACILGGGFDLYFPRIDEGAYVPDLCRAAFDMRLAA